MKKILFAIFAVILLVPSAYSDDLGYISMASSTSDVMNSVISAGAIIDAFADSYNGGCGFLSSEDKEKVAILVYGATIYPEVRDLTVHIVYSILYNLLLDPALSRYDSSNIEKVQRCLMAIIEQHNAIVRDAERQKQELQSAEWQEGKVFTSEQEYNKTLQEKGLCSLWNTSTFYMGQKARTLNNCKELCKNFAIASACYLEAVGYEDKKCRCYKAETGENASSLSVFQSLKPYYFIPTWEDYKKLYNIK